jgi:D-beta-D-heptose 7-phosphate kinase/D-beta-D-heptose 1-phosphate adenosyltransferase
MGDQTKIVCCSGGFDPIHDGHIDYFGHAKKFGRLVVILNSDDWLIRKKGYCLLPFATRMRVLLSFKIVMRVVRVDDSDGSVSEALRRLRPAYFANGGDRTVDNTRELEVCGQLGIVPLFNIGGGKTASSSDLVRAACRQMNS